MIEFEVEAKRSKTPVAESAKARYLVLGDFGGRVAEPALVDRDTLDAVMARLDVSLGSFKLREVEDFHPDHLYARLADFHQLDEPEPAEPARTASAPKPQLEEILERGSILEQITGGTDPFQRYLQDLARAHAAPAKRDDTARVAALGEKMRALLHHPRFQAIEAAWRGMDFVVRNADEDKSMVYVAQLSREDLDRDLGAASDLRATRTFKLLTDREWKGVFGLYSFGSSTADIELLGRIGLIAGHAKTPFVAEGAVDMGGHWSELRAIPESKYIGLGLPRLLLRLPYGAKASAVESFKFEEMPGRPVHAHYLWGNPAVAVLALASRGGIEEDELDLTSLPLHTYEEDGEWKMTPCAEVWLRETQAQALIELGMMPLVSFRDSDRVRVGGIRAINGSALPL